MKQAMHYFWASLFLQIMVYALLSHVLIKYGGDTQILLLSLSGIILFLPFTVVLIKKFKQMAIVKTEDENPGTSINNYILQHHTLLKSFYRFKRRYELLLIPLSSAIGVFLVFKLFVPGGIEGNMLGACIIFVTTVAGCIWSILLENQKSFIRPLHELDKLIQEFKSDK